MNVLLKEYVTRVIREMMSMNPTVLRVNPCTSNDRSGMAGDIGIPEDDGTPLDPHLTDDDDPTTDSQGPVPQKTPPIPVVVDPYVQDAYRY